MKTRPSSSVFIRVHLWLITGLLALTPIAILAWNGGAAKIRFEEIAAKAHVQPTHHTRVFPGKNGDVLRMFTSGGAAVAVGDYDNDGFDDLFVTDSDNGRKSHLYHNNGNLTFTEVTEAAGVGGGNDPLSIVADALWFDYDNDGKLDLMFGNYFKPENLLDLKTPHVLPNDLDNAVNGGGVTLWKGDGKGHFVEVTAKAGFSNHTGWTLDIGHGDFNNDGLQDIYLACDYGTDRMYLNNGDGTFREVTEKAIGYDTKKGMNVDIADYDNDGWLDIYVTNITDEYMKECNMLWHNNGDGTFTDLSKETGPCETLWGWAAKFGDFDNDGWQDLFVVNGLRSASKENYIPVLVNLITKPGVDFTDVNNWPNIGNMTWSGYQKKKMFRNLGTQAFKEISADAGVDNDKDGRGIGMSDFDNDGRLDFYQTNADQPALLYHNITEGAGNWVELKLVGTKSNRDAIGARVTLKAGGQSMIREVNGGNGYSGQSSLRLHFGIGHAAKIDSVEIRWPSGIVQKETLAINKITKITEPGAGK